jgi:hypothetical protein
LRLAKTSFQSVNARKKNHRQSKVRDREDAIASARDACATRS